MKARLLRNPPTLIQSAWTSFGIVKQIAYVLFVISPLITFAETYVDDHIKSNTVWTSAGSPYIVNRWENCNIGSPQRDVTLTIEAGVEVIFRNTDTLSVETNATLIVNGTDTSRVMFRKHQTEGRSSFKVAFNGNGTVRNAVFDGTGSRFTLCEIKDPNASVLFRYCEFKNAEHHGLRIGSDCHAKVEHCKFHDNGRSSIFQDRPLGNPTENYIKHCRFHNHADRATAAIEVAMHADGTAMPELSDNTGDNDSFVLFNAINVDKEFPSMTFSLPGVLDNGESMPYVISGGLSYRSPEGEASQLIISAGNCVELDGSVSLDGVSLRVSGTEDQPVLFTKTDRWDDDPAVWGELQINPAEQSEATVLQYAIFEYGGAGGRGAVVYKNGQSSAELLVSHCLFRNNEDAGLFIEQAFSETGGTVTVESSVFHDNADSDLEIHGGTLFHPVHAISDCRFYNSADPQTAAIRCQPTRALLTHLSGDNDAFIRIENPLGAHNSNLHLSFPGFLDDGNPMPYVLCERWWISPDENTPAGVMLSIDPGCVIESQTFPQNWSPHITIQSNASIVANGSANRPVVFSTTDRFGDDQDYWNGVRIEKGARAEECMFNHIAFDGGNPALELEAGPVSINHGNFRGGNNSGIEIDTFGSAVISDCSFSDYENHAVSAGGGGYYDEPVTTSISRCTFTGNKIGIYSGYPAVGTTLSDCSFSDNIDYAVYNDRKISIDARSCDWGGSYGPLDDSDEEDTNYQLGYMYYNPAGTGGPVSDNVLYTPWVGSVQKVSLTLRVSNCERGGTWPLIGIHETDMGTPITIAAINVCGAEFTGWTLVSGQALIADTSAQVTAVTPLGDCVIEAGFESSESEFDVAYNAWSASYDLPKDTLDGYDPRQDSDGNNIPDVMAFARGTHPLTSEKPPIATDYADDEFLITFNQSTSSLDVVDFSLEGTGSLSNPFSALAPEDYSVSTTPTGALNTVTMKIPYLQEQFFFRLILHY